MRYLLATIIAAFALALEANSISVPTGKKTPITPAKPTPRPIYPNRISRASIPVVEYSYDNPEPAPLDPSYVPIPIKYFHALIPKAITYVPVRVRNYAYYDDKENNDIREQLPVVATRELDYSRPIKRPVYDYSNTKYATKPLYYLAKGAPSERVPTKGGYPKKATAYASNNKFFYYNNNQN